MKTLTACSGTKLAIQLSPKSESLKSQVAMGSEKENVSQETLSAYETCMRGKLQEVTAAWKKLDRMVSQEFEEQTQEQARKKRQRELQEQAEHAESVKKAAKAARESKNKEHDPEELPNADADIPKEVGGFCTHSCRVVSELLDMLNITVEVAQTGSAVDDSLASSSVTVFFCDDIANDSIPLIALDTPTLISHKLMENVVKVHGDENVPQWLNPLVTKLVNDGTKNSVVCPKDDTGTSAFLFAKHDGLKRVLSQLDGLSLRACQWETNELFKDETRRHILKTLKSVIVNIYEPGSFFSGTYDMMSGRVMYCLSGCRLFVGIPFTVALEACGADTGEEVNSIAQLARWIKASCSLEKVTETGFYAFLRAGEVLVVPPAFFVLECCLGAEIGKALVASYPVMLQASSTPPCPEKCSLPDELHTVWDKGLSNFKKVLPQDANANTFSNRAQVLADLIYMTAVKVEVEQTTETPLKVGVLPELDEEEYNSLRSPIEKLDEQQILARISDIKKRSDFPAFAKHLLAETQDTNAVASFGMEDALEDLIEFETWLLRMERAKVNQQAHASAVGATPTHGEIIQSQLPQAPEQHSATGQVQEASAQHSTAEQVQEAPPQEDIAEQVQEASAQHSATEQVQEAPPQQDTSTAQPPTTKQVEEASSQHLTNGQVQEASAKHSAAEQVQEAPPQQDTSTAQPPTTKQVEEASSQHLTNGQVQEASAKHSAAEQVQEAPPQQDITEQVQAAPTQQDTTQQVEESSAQHPATTEQQCNTNAGHISHMGFECNQPEPAPAAAPAELSSNDQTGDTPDPCEVQSAAGEATAMKQKQQQFFDPSTYAGKIMQLPPPEKMGKSDQPQTLTASAKASFFDTATYHSKCSGLPSVPAGKLVSTEVHSTADEKRSFFGSESKEKTQHQVDVSKSQEAQSLAAKADLAVKQHMLRARSDNADDTSQAHPLCFFV